MASPRLIIALIPFLLLSLVIHSTTAADEQPKPPAKPVEVVVEGVVYCQSCKAYGTWSLTGAKPVKSATVSVICKDHRNLVSYYKAFDTDKNGYFYGELKGFKMGHTFLDHPLHACKVKMVSSPLDSCNVLTNVNNGRYGAPLRYENKRIVGPHYEAVIYAAGPLAFRPPNCAPSTEEEADPSV